MSYMTISSQENHHFSLCSYFHAHPTTLLLKILGGPMHVPSPHLKFWGDRPPSPPRSPPLGIPERFEDAKICGKEFARWSKKSNSYSTIALIKKHKRKNDSRRTKTEFKSLRRG